MNVLLTGATGFIGRYTAMDLISRGYEVYGLVRASSARREGLPEKLNIVEMDLRELRAAAMTGSSSNLSDTCDTEDQLESYDEGRLPKCWRDLPEIDACIHLAWAGAARDGRMNTQLQQDNVEDTLALIRAVAAKGCTRFIFSGSQAEYGITVEDAAKCACFPQTTERTPCHPRSEYGRAKLEVLHRASQLCRELNMTYIHMRLFSIYGAGDQQNSLISLCAKAFARGETMAAASPCTQMWNFLHVKDCAAAIALLVSCPFLTDADAGDEECAVNVAGARSRVLRDYIEEIATLASPPGQVTFGEKLNSPEGTPYLDPDISKLVSLTGFKECVTWEAGARDALNS
jgi:UDP-glucose 4-epimerase